MKVQRVVLIVLLTATAGLSGCASSRPAREQATSAASLEEAFKERWVTKRVGELLLQGTASDGIQARKLALQEFRDRFEYVRGVDRR